VYIRTYVRTYLLTYIVTYIHTYIFTYIHTYINTYIHINIHTYIRTYINNQNCCIFYIHSVRELPMKLRATTHWYVTSQGSDESCAIHQTSCQTMARVLNVCDDGDTIHINETKNNSTDTDIKEGVLQQHTCHEGSYFRRRSVTVTGENERPRVMPCLYDIQRFTHKSSVCTSIHYSLFNTLSGKIPMHLYVCIYVYVCLYI